LNTASNETPGEGHRARRNPLNYLPQVGALVTITATIIGLVFVFRPGCTPQDVGKATIGEVRVVQPVTFRRYLQRLELPPGTLSREQLRRRGVLIEFHYEINGFRGKKLPLRWELNDATTNNLIGQDQAVTITPSTNAEGRKWFVWVPAPKTRRRYYVTVTIYQPDGTVPLQDFDSPKFRGLGGA
jgi:hypothetical protein